jgi:hypothetical protein
MSVDVHRPSRHQRTARRTANGVLHVAVAEACALARQTVNVGGFHHRVALAGEALGPHLVRHEEGKVGFLCRPGSGAFGLCARESCRDRDSGGRKKVTAGYRVLLHLHSSLPAGILPAKCEIDSRDLGLVIQLTELPAQFLNTFRNRRAFLKQTDCRNARCASIETRSDPRGRDAAQRQERNFNAVCHF